MCRNNTK